MSWRLSSQRGTLPPDGGVLEAVLERMKLERELPTLHKLVGRWFHNEKDVGGAVEPSSGLVSIGNYRRGAADQEPEDALSFESRFCGLHGPCGVRPTPSDSWAESCAAYRLGRKGRCSRQRKSHLHNEMRACKLETVFVSKHLVYKTCALVVHSLFDRFKWKCYFFHKSGIMSA